MSWLHRLRALIRNLFRRAAVDRDLNDELASYLELAEDEARAAGVAPSEARRQARVRLSGTAAVTESVWSNRAGAGLERLWQDGRYALRSLRRAPGFAAAVSLTLALGIGANTAAFSVIDAAIFKQLPYARPNELVELVTVANRGTPEEARSRGTILWSQLDAWRRQPQIWANGGIRRMASRSARSTCRRRFRPSQRSRSTCAAAERPTPSHRRSDIW